MSRVTGRSSRAVAVAALLVIAITGIMSSGASASPGRPADAAAGTPANPEALCTAAQRIRKAHTVDTSRVHSHGVVRLSGRDFAFRDDAWRGYTPTDPTISQFFHSGAWIVPLYADDSALALEVFLDQAAASPDPGGSASRPDLLRGGWAEYHVTLRTWTALCLYAQSSDLRLLPSLESLIAANLDEARYYGPPRRPPHNHGVFANEALRAAGLLLGRSDLVDRARVRLDAMFARVFDPCGMVREQSSFYQALNIRLWSRNVGDNPGTAQGVVLDAARRALSALVRPDGVLEPIGDGVAGAWSPEDLAALGVHPGGSVFCPATGWAAAHRVTPEGGLQHHVVRFGPSPRMHGHADHGAATWWVSAEGEGDGVPVLVDRGLYDNSMDSRRTWADSPLAHSVLRLIGEAFTGSTRGETLASPGTDAYRLTTATARGKATRVLSFDSGSPVMGAVDDFVVASGGAVRPVQSWHLGPAWVISGAHTAVTRDGAHTLDVFCRVDDALIDPVIARVEHFAGYRTSVDALEVRCRAARGRSVRIETVLAVDATTPRAGVRDGRLSVTTDRGTHSFDSRGVLVAR